MAEMSNPNPNPNPKANRQLTLHKGEEYFVFRYQSGQEAEVIDSFAELANNPDSVFDWFDAAILSYQMGRPSVSELDQESKPDVK